jgi:hypothetical protein
MKRSQVYNRITRWDGKGALYIVAHAKFQKRRGRNASEPYKGESNPLKALKLALAELKTFVPMCGSYISTMIAEMVDVARFTNQEVSGEFNGVTVTANPKSSPEELVAWWSNEMNRRSEEYHNSDEYKQRQREAEEAQRRKELMLEYALQSAPEKMTLRDEEDCKKLAETKTDDWGSAIIRYAELWARLMEGRIANGATLEGCADETSHLADNEGITGFMYGCAVSFLSHVWIHGEQLRRWHNLSTQLGNEGEKANEIGGVLNPTLLNIG